MRLSIAKAPSLIPKPISLVTPRPETNVLDLESPVILKPISSFVLSSGA